MTTTYLWPVSGQAARGQSLATSGANIVVGDDYNPVAWEFTPTAGGSPVAFSTTDGGSIAAMVNDGSGNLYALNTAGLLYGPNGEVTLPSGVYSDAIYASGAVYALQYGGQLVNASGTLETTFVAPTACAAYAVSGYIAAFGASGMGLSVPPSGTPSYVALPSGVANVTCAASVSGFMAAAGYAPYSLGSGYATMAADAAAIQIVAVTAGSATVYSAASTGTNLWTPVTTLTGLSSSPVSCAWTPNGTQILISDTANNLIKVLGYSAGALSVAQTASLGAAGMLAVADNTHALVCTGGTIVPLLQTGGTWATNPSNDIVLANSSAVLLTTPSTAVATTTSGVAKLSLVVNTWSVTSTAALSFTPTQLALDNTGTVYAAATGHFAAINGAQVKYGTLDGACTAMAAFNSQVSLLEYPTSAQLHVIGNPSASSTWSQQSSVTTAVGSGHGLLLVNETLFCYGSSDTALYNFGAPYTVVPVRGGEVSFYNFSTSGWTSVPLGPDNVPTAIADTGSGSAYVTTTNNNLYTVAPSGIVSSGVVAQQSGQPQNVPLGTSGILVSGAVTYVSTSMTGALIKLS
jgi:hypothetical protein